MSEINVTPSVQKAIELRKQNRESESRNEIKGIKIAREANGDNLQSTNISSSVDTSNTGIDQEIKKAENALDTSLPATNNDKTNEKKKKETEETNKEIEAKNLNIIASWSSLGGKEGVS